MHIVIYVVPLGIAFRFGLCSALDFPPVAEYSSASPSCRSDPLYALLSLIAITATLKSYLTLGDISLGVALLPLFPSIIPRSSPVPCPLPSSLSIPSTF